jgi:mannose-1-phosphate guanylyltransferase
MKAMVFAAGYGQRLRPVTKKVPKALIPVGGRPMIEYSLLLLRHYGIREIVINVHHLGEQIEAHLQNGKRLGLDISYSRESRLLDTGGGLRKARRFFTGERFVAINSDVMIDLNLEEVLGRHRHARATATLVLRKDPKADAYGLIEASADLRIRSFLGHKAPASRPPGPLSKFMFTGVQVVEPKIFDYMESLSADDPEVFSITKVTYPRLLLRGEPLYAYPFDGYWQDLGTPERLKQAAAKLQSGEVRLHYLK